MILISRCLDCNKNWVFIVLIDNCEFKLIDNCKRLIDTLEKIRICIANWVVNSGSFSDCEVI